MSTKISDSSYNQLRFKGLYVSGELELHANKKQHLTLKDTSLLTDEQLLDIAQIIFDYSDGVVVGSSEYYVTMIKDKFNKQTINATSRIVDYLRYHGYAWEWMGLTVVDQINYGWIMLKLKVGNEN